MTTTTTTTTDAVLYLLPPTLPLIAPEKRQTTAWEKIPCPGHRHLQCGMVEASALFLTMSLLESGTLKLYLELTRLARAAHSVAPRTEMHRRDEALARLQLQLSGQVDHIPGRMSRGLNLVEYRCRPMANWNAKYCLKSLPIFDLSFLRHRQLGCKLWRSCRHAYLMHVILTVPGAGLCLVPVFPDCRLVHGNSPTSRGKTSLVRPWSRLTAFSKMR